MDREMHDSMEGQFIPMFSVASGMGQEIFPDLYCYTNQIVNLCFVGQPNHPNGWVLIDAGMPESADQILEAAEERFGMNSKPRAIILTHGHFDHIGAIVDLVREWKVSVYAHRLEIPYLTGQKGYSDPDGTVEGGMVAKLSPLFPNEPVDLGDHISELPSDNHVPHLPNWRWIHTPGHSPGHVSFYRGKDRTLIAGDAFVTVDQDSIFKVMAQYTEISGPPRYLTTDWAAAKESVIKLANLNPSITITGHGQPVAGEELKTGLKRLANEFDQIAVPDSGRFVDQ